MSDPKTIGDTAKTAKFAALFCEIPMADLITDATANIGVVEFQNRAFICSTSDVTPTPNCYLCSPTTAYINYAIAETRALALPRVLQGLALFAIKSFTPLVRATGLDTQIQVNNWMVSTNQAPDVSVAFAEALKTTCVTRYPNRAIVMRSLNDVSDAASIGALRGAGFKMLAARQVYIFPKDPAKPSRDVHRDAKILKDTKLHIVEGGALSDVEFERCIDLYEMLYFDKYTTLNPHYTARFLREMDARGVMRLVALRDPDAGIVGFTALFELHGTLTQPLVGYDTGRAQHEGLYRMLMQIGREHAQTRNLDSNMSAGAARFKRNRGGVAAIEYTAVYVAHLSWKNRAATACLAVLSRKFGIPLVKRIEA